MWHQWFNLNFMKLREYFCVRRKQKWRLYSTISSLHGQSSARIHKNITMQVCAFLCLQTRCSTIWVLRQNTGSCVRSFTRIWYCHERMSKTDKEENKLLIKVVIFVFIGHKKYSRSFIKLRLNHCYHMDYFNDVLTTFLGLEYFSSVAVYAGSESSRISWKIS